MLQSSFAFSQLLLNPEQHFSLVKSLSVTIQKKAIEQYLQGWIQWGRQTFLDLGGLNSGGKFFQ